MHYLKLYFLILSLLAIYSGTLLADQTVITVRADQVVQPVNNCLRGVCIEDVNHEVYGGLYSQMIFGESFQEPPIVAEINGFKAYGGNWVLRDKAIEITGTDGPKLVSDHAPYTDGTINVEMLFADRSGQNAGLLVRVNHPATGADSFTGYEVSVDPLRQIARLARHHNNFELIADTPCDIPVGKWFALGVKLSGAKIEISVDGKAALRHDDGAEALPDGTFALRSWHSKAK